MKKIFFKRMIFLIVCLCCKLSGVQAQVDITIGGHFSKELPKGTKFNLIVLDEYALPNWFAFSTVYKSEISEDGSFQLNFKPKSSKLFVSFKLEGSKHEYNYLNKDDNNYTLYLMEAGDSLRMDISDDNVIFSGKGEDRMNCQQAIYANQIFPRNAILPLLRQKERKNSGDYVKSLIGLIDKNLQTKLAILDLYKNDLTDSVSQIIKYNTIGGAYLTLCSQFWLNKGKVGFDFPVFRQEYLNWLSQTPEDGNDLAAYAPLYIKYLFEREQSRAAYTKYPDKIAQDFEFSDILQTITTMPVNKQRDALLTASAINLAERKAGVQDTAASIYNMLKDPTIKDLFERWQSKTGNNVPAYAFSLPDTSGHMHRLKDFKGKMILIDLWFNGCFGCKYMNKEMRKIIDHFKSKNAKNIVFISLSVDKTRKGWINGLKTKEYSQPEQLKLSTYGTSWFDNPFYKHYNFKGAPQLLLIDKKGNVISSAPPDPRFDGGKALTELMEKNL
nr:thioredoxin-like domain-containing protein [uncultured Sphingobacterium sp.]